MPKPKRVDLLACLMSTLLEGWTALAIRRLRARFRGRLVPSLDFPRPVMYHNGMSYAETRAKAKDLDEQFRQLSERQKINALYFLWGYVAASEDPAGCESAIEYVQRYHGDDE